MPNVDVKGRKISAKLVFYGTGLGGKTTNLRFIHKKTNPKRRGDLISLETESERTLFFDFFPMAAGKIMGFDLSFVFYTVPGQSFYNLTRKTILKDADGVVFVADSHVDREDANIDSFLNLQENLREHRIELADFPHVIQYNKRDLDDIMPVEQMRQDLNLYGVPDFEASAVTGEGVFETLRAIVGATTEKVKKELER